MAAPVKDRVPPHNDEAERAVLGAMLIDPNAIVRVQQYLDTGDFNSGRHKKIYEALLKLFNMGTNPDLLTITGELEKMNALIDAGGYDYIAGLTHAVPSSVNVEYYAERVQECSLRRGLISISSIAGSRAYDETVEAKLLLEETQQELIKISDPRRIFHYKKAGNVVKETVDYIDTARKLKAEYTGIPSGFKKLDSLTSGFQNSELTIIGARPGMGKTAIGLNMAADIAIRQKKCAAFFSLEMTNRSLMLRLLSSESGIDSSKLKNGLFEKSEHDKLFRAGGRLFEAPLIFVDMPHMTLLNIQAMARMLRLQEKVEIIFIDYIGLIAQDKSYVKRFDFFSEVSRSLKWLTAELNIPIVALSQLRRPEDRRNRPPSLADIRESGSIEQDADMVMFLYHEELDKPLEEQEKEPTSKIKLMLAKNRNGPIGTVNLSFHKYLTKFEPRDDYEG